MERQRLIGKWLVESGAELWLAGIGILFIIGCLVWGLRAGDE